MTTNDEYNGYFADCYVLTNRRTKEIVNKFLETFVPQREESTDVYELPQYQEKTDITFEKDSDLIDYVVQNKSIPYTIYWRNAEKLDLRNIMCFFTNDGELILGLSTETKFPNTEIEDFYFKKLQEFAESEIGLITYEEPAPDNAKEFKEMIKARKHNTR